MPISAYHSSVDRRVITEKDKTTIIGLRRGGMFLYEILERYPGLGEERLKRILDEATHQPKEKKT